MQNQRFKPKFDKLYWLSLSLCAVYMIVMTAISVGSRPMMIITGSVNLVLLWVLVAPWFGYVELREDVIWIRFGFFLKREVAYASIKRMQKVRHWYSESMIALKNAMEHVDIRYNACDVVSVSVTDNDALIEAIEQRRSLLDARAR